MTAQTFKYDPYGGSTTTNNSGYSSAYQNPFTFGEGLLDRATGEVKFGHRYYSPVTGTWTQQDALNAPLDPDNADRYAYASDNPINGLDPTGALSILDLVEHCGEGAVEGLFTGFFTGEDETGIGAVEAAVKGCGISSLANFVEQEGDEELGEEIEDADTLHGAAEVIENILGDS